MKPKEHSCVKAYKVPLLRPGKCSVLNSSANYVMIADKNTRLITNLRTDQIIENN